MKRKIQIISINLLSPSVSSQPYLQPLSFSPNHWGPYQTSGLNISYLPITALAFISAYNLFLPLLFIRIIPFTPKSQIFCETSSELTLTLLASYHSTLSQTFFPLVTPQVAHSNYHFVLYVGLHVCLPSKLLASSEKGLFLPVYLVLAAVCGAWKAVSWLVEENFLDYVLWSQQSNRVT